MLIRTLMLFVVIMLAVVLCRPSESSEPQKTDITEQIKKWMGGSEAADPMIMARLQELLAAEAFLDYDNSHGRLSNLQRLG
ncbi:unnamed protein product [Caenorhabditis auriculariae]|uniref:Uncharacterized protein n=1 Tax=Caenorhabditis auriculariae TaxID=2777116 RepID=A0A8S1HJY9_9PELO|nr:unnamed protein product [Caenorhabditis auriculariae]